ncbi:MULTISPECIES: hypothetical protein [Kitasatospora]|nr:MULTISPECIES: hypothetical protein [Kitasatospora]
MGVFPPTGVPGTRVEAPPVNGREAYWFSTDDPGSAGMVVLRFRGSDGRWVDLSDTSGGDRLAERRQRLQQMASSVVSGDYTPPLPLSMSSLPPQTVVTTVTLTMPAKGGSDWGLMMGFQEQGTHNIGIDVVPQERASVPTTAFPTLPNGLPVQQKKCETGKGLQWCVDSLQPVPGSEVADPAAWMARVVPHGMDQKTWTTGLLP